MTYSCLSLIPVCEPRHLSVLHYIICTFDSALYIIELVAGLSWFLFIYIYRERERQTSKNNTENL